MKTEGNNKKLLFLLLLCLGLAATVISLNSKKETRKSAEGSPPEIRLAFYGCYPDDLIIGQKCFVSALVFNQDNPVFDGYQYSWYVSSGGSLVNLKYTEGKTNEFSVLSFGEGDLVVIATGVDQLQKSVRLRAEEVNYPLIEFSSDCNLSALQRGYKCNMSAVVYEGPNQPNYDDYDYTWSISSESSLGNLRYDAGKVNVFYPTGPGQGVLVVVARHKDGRSDIVQKSMVLKVLSYSSFCTYCENGVPQHGEGNVNCDRAVNLIDFTEWLAIYQRLLKGEAIEEQSLSRVDLNCQESNSYHEVDLVDFSIWLTNYITGLN